MSLCIMLSSEQCEALLQRALLKCKMSSCMCILKYEFEVTDCTGHMLAAFADVPLTISFLMHMNIPLEAGPVEDLRSPCNLNRFLVSISAVR